MKIKIILIISILFLLSCNKNKANKRTSENSIKIDENFDTLLKIFNDTTTQSRGKILHKLNEFDDKRKIKILEKSLFDKNEFVKIIAIQTINSNNQKESSDKLLKLFITNQNHTLNSNLCRTFADFDFKKAIPEIKKKTKSENSMIVYDCVWTLGEIGTENDIEFLNKMLENKVKPVIYDKEGFLSQTTEFTIGELALKSINKINKASR